MGSGLSMAARAEITAKYARQYARASKKDKGRLLDGVVAVTGWSRDNARRQLRTAAKPRPARPRRRRRPRKYSYDALKVLQRVWAFSGYECGKYLAVAMPTLLDSLERHGELVAGKRRYSRAVRAELEQMSAATIDRYLAPARARDPLYGKSTTKPSPLLRNSIRVRKAGDEAEGEPGFFEGDTVAHCGPTLKGEFARTLNLTDMCTGWVFTRSIRNNAHVHILSGLDAAVASVPFMITGLDFDNGSEFINHDVIGWAAGRDIFFTRSRPYKKNDQATIESKNNHLVRRYGFYWRYDTPEALKLLNALWPLVGDRMNYFTPTKKPIGWTTDAAGRRKRVYDTPATPLERLLDAGVLSPAQEAELIAYRDSLNPADLARRIQTIQDRLTGLARDATLALQAQATTASPDTGRGVKIRPAS
ncbi:integrase catalytic domain-containing protein [Tomitella gaofuii]|uniref:integrase catalytic domain-containing protein n=1 Tax=Tomitella gaofuii TaxID=2760083 RepID=UPI001F35223A|nr:DDE-type integrase/transposase/recombinase [Tomitella gaofuii]